MNHHYHDRLWPDEARGTHSLSPANPFLLGIRNNTVSLHDMGWNDQEFVIHTGGVRILLVSSIQCCVKKKCCYIQEMLIKKWWWWSLCLSFCLPYCWVSGATSSGEREGERMRLPRLRFTGCLLLHQELITPSLHLLHLIPSNTTTLPMFSTNKLCVVFVFVVWYSFWCEFWAMYICCKLESYRMVGIHYLL